MEIKNLYQEVILEHNKNPLNYGKIDPCTHEQLGNNPLCGDKLILYLNIENDIIQNVSFQGEGCAISKASTSLLTQRIKNKSLKEATFIINTFEKLVIKKDSLSKEEKDAIGKLIVLEGVQQYPARVKCAFLSFRTLEALILPKE